jgi:hypothetical protein
MNNNMTEWPPYVEWEGRSYGQNRVMTVGFNTLINARKNGIGGIGIPVYDGAMAEIGKKLDIVFPDEKASFQDAGALVDETRGPIIEVGGPTEDYSPVTRPSIIAERLERPLFISNIARIGAISLQADGTGLPFRDASIGIMFASCLPQDVRNDFYVESHRTLEDGGILAYKNARDLDMAHVLSLGFKMVAYRRSMNTYIGDNIEIRDRTWSIFMQK